MLIRILCILTALPALLLAQDQAATISCAIGEEAYTFSINPAAIPHIPVIQKFIDAASEFSKQTPLNFPYDGDGEALKAIFSDNGLMHVIVDLNTDPSGAEEIVAKLEEAIQAKKLMPKKVASLMITADILGIEPIIKACALHIANNPSCYYRISQEGRSNFSSAQTIAPETATVLPRKLKAFIAHQCWNKKAYQSYGPSIHSPVGSIALSSDNTILTNTLFDGTILLYDANIGTLITTLARNEYPIGFKLRSSDDTISIASLTGTVDGIRIYSKTSSYGITKFTYPRFTPIYSPHSDTFVTGSIDGTIKLWEPDGFLKKRVIGHTESVISVAFSPAGDMLASGSADGTIKLWGPNAYNHIITLPDQHNVVSFVIFSSDGTILASQSTDGAIKLWRIPGTIESFLRKPECELDSMLTAALKTSRPAKRKLDSDAEKPASKRALQPKG